LKDDLRLVIGSVLLSPVDFFKLYLGQERRFLLGLFEFISGIFLF